MILHTEKNPIHVVLAADQNYAMPLTVAICSAARSCDRTRQLVFNVIQNGISLDVRNKIESSLKKIGFVNAQINWLAVPLERFEGLKIAQTYITPMTYARLLVPDILPVELEKVLYLDCDIVVNDNLGELWDMDLGEKSLYAARDSIRVSDPRGIVNYRELGIPPDTKYFNAGVLLINLMKWRKLFISDQVFGYLRTYHEIIQLNDQEAMNAILWNDWEELEYRWNWQIVWRGYRLGWAKRLWIPEADKKSIIHFSTEEKPWLPGCDYEEKKYFFEHLDRTEWVGWRVPWWKEVVGRSRRAVGDARNALGRVRQRIMASMSDPT